MRNSIIATSEEVTLREEANKIIQKFESDSAIARTNDFVMAKYRMMGNEKHTRELEADQIEKLSKKNGTIYIEKGGVCIRLEDYLKGNCFKYNPNIRLVKTGTVTGNKAQEILSEFGKNINFPNADSYN